MSLDRTTCSMLLLRSQWWRVHLRLGYKELQPEESGEEVCGFLNERDIPARFEPVRDCAQDVGATLLDATARAEADLLVMGGFAHARQREFLFESATCSLFRSGFPLPLLLSH